MERQEKLSQMQNTLRRQLQLHNAARLPLQIIELYESLNFNRKHNMHRHSNFLYKHKNDNILIVFTSIKEKLIDFTEFFKYNRNKGETQ